MSVIVTDTGFHPDDWTGGFIALADLDDVSDHSGRALDLPSDTNPAALGNALTGFALIRIEFPAFSDGRGFTIARSLRRLGYTGRLRAKGHLLADQYPMARRVGFDEVEISDDLAARQPEAHWQSRADWRAYDYRSRLRG